MQQLQQCSQFVFPQGHQIRIAKFIDSVKSQYSLTGKKRFSSNTRSSQTDGDTVRALTTYNCKRMVDHLRRMFGTKKAGYSWCNTSSRTKAISTYYL